jgi:hypothetical protein
MEKSTSSFELTDEDALQVLNLSNDINTQINILENLPKYDTNY